MSEKRHISFRNEPDDFGRMTEEQIKAAEQVSIVDYCQANGIPVKHDSGTNWRSATNEVLDGAEFVLRDANGADVKLSKDADGAYQPDANGSTVIQTTNGKAVIKNLKDMSYTLTETKAPDGFDGYFEPVKIQMDEKNTLDNPFLVTIFNAPTGSKTGTGAQTGGNGLPVWLLFVAFGAIAGAVAIMVLKKKKQRISDGK